MVSSDRAPGDHFELKHIKATISDDPNYQDLSRECQKELMDKLMALRMRKKFSICVNNKAVAMDAHNSISRIQQEVRAALLSSLLSH